MKKQEFIKNWTQEEVNNIEKIYNYDLTKTYLETCFVFKNREIEELRTKVKKLEEKIK
jgi:DNA-binding transcriptional regulator YiaG